MSPARGPVVVLAAGSGTRMGAAAPDSHPLGKLALTVEGHSILWWTLNAVSLDDVPEAIVVMRPGGELPADCADLPLQVVTAPDAHLGMAWSLRAGLAACSPDAAGAFVVLADDPLAARALPVVHAHAARHPRSITAVRRVTPVPHPVYLPRTSWDLLTPGDSGFASALRRPGTEWVDAPGCPDPVDVDRPRDLERLAPLLRPTP